MDKVWADLELYSKRLAEAAQRKAEALCKVNHSLIRDCMEVIENPSKLSLYLRLREPV